MVSRAASADGGTATKPPRQRPKARDVKERAKGKRPRRPPPVGHRQALPDQLEDPNEYGVRVRSTFSQTWMERRSTQGLEAH